MDPAVLAAHAAFRRWLFEAALPLWADGGCDPGFGAHEYLEHSGLPGLPGFKRLRVQARQLVVFSQAAIEGWAPGRERAHEIHRFMASHSAGHFWARRLTRAGEILDPTSDLYDLSFVLLALAWYARMTGETSPIIRADALLDWLDRALGHPAGGYANSFPEEAGWRQQNPHMHLLEALLALYETTRSAEHAGRAADLVALFRNRLFDRRTGTLGEHFAADWTIASGDAGDRVEPGHHYEWVWLLDEAERLLGSDTSAERVALYQFCERHAIDAATGLVRDELARDGTVRRGSARLWVQTEALRAQCVMRGEAEIPRIVDNLLGRYFAHPVAGAWVDQLDASFAPASGTVPASSLYHIVTGFAALDGFVRYANAPPGSTQSPQSTPQSEAEPRDTTR